MEQYAPPGLVDQVIVLVRSTTPVVCLLTGCFLRQHDKPGVWRGNVEGSIYRYFPTRTGAGVRRSEAAPADACASTRRDEKHA